jgi:hypothetical protein
MKKEKKKIYLNYISRNRRRRIASSGGPSGSGMVTQNGNHVVTQDGSYIVTQ